jgi:hypothetical protein
VKAPNFATGQDQPTNGVWITRPALKAVAEVDCTEFVLVSSAKAIVPHSDEGNLIG